ncbi:MAG: hypothetical protein U5J64_11160 [Halobacteriales archaeon]|nr:hypothetical protein [Halobacteriales archaeon]
MDTFKKTLDDTTGGAITAQKERERRIREQQRRQQAQNNTRTPANTAETSSTTLEQSLEPVLKAEKSDLMFWMMVLQVLLLVGIWRNTNSGG